jgi:hypothetical protein
LSWLANGYQLSLIHPQLKIGSANQRYPDHPQRFFSAEIQNNRNREHQWNKEGLATPKASALFSRQSGDAVHFSDDSRSDSKNTGQKWRMAYERYRAGDFTSHLLCHCCLDPVLIIMLGASRIVPCVICGCCYDQAIRTAVSGHWVVAANIRSCFPASL